MIPMNDEKHRLAPFGAQPFGLGPFSPELRCISLTYIQYVALNAPCSRKNGLQRWFLNSVNRPWAKIGEQGEKIFN